MEDSSPGTSPTDEPQPHPFNRYLEKHGHYPRARINNGSAQQVEVMLAPGYARICTYPYGTYLYVTASSLRRLIEWIEPKLAVMTEDFDAPAAIRNYLEAEDLMRGEAAEAKRQRSRERKAEAQRQRFERARARAQEQTE